MIPEKIQDYSLPQRGIRRLHAKYEHNSLNIVLNILAEAKQEVVLNLDISCTIEKTLRNIDEWHFLHCDFEKCRAII